MTRREILLAALTGDSPLQVLTEGPKHHFFGYYGVSPWNHRGDHVLCLESDFQNRMPLPGETARIGLAGRPFVPLVETRAWNLQQGAMLNWNPLSPNDEFLYNDYENGDVVSAAFDIRRKKRRTWPRAIESVAANGKFATCVTYGRLARLRPVVGYAAAKDPNPEANHPDNDGVHVLNLATGKSHLAVSIRDVYQTLKGKHPELREKAMFFQHSVINPASTRFFFLARTIERGRLTSAMFTASLDGTGLREVVPYGRGVSHFTWRGPSEIMATFSMEGKVRHVLFSDTPSPAFQAVAPEQLEGDGHCTFGPSREIFATDKNVPAVPAKRLFVYDLRSKLLRQLGEFPMKLPNGEEYLSGDTRCDLHPRWKRTGDAIAFDAIDTRTWTRQLHVASV
ncbi:MAG: hypothetical protein FJW30_27535 [Acidobacteria bacterium]|nr:hypothetical protein [Acidobacteriota bacterium]